MRTQFALNSYLFYRSLKDMSVHGHQSSLATPLPPTSLLALLGIAHDHASLSMPSEFSNRYHEA